MQNKDNITALSKHLADDFINIYERRRCREPKSINTDKYKDIEIQLFEKHVNEKVKGEFFTSLLFPC